MTRTCVCAISDVAGVRANYDVGMGDVEKLFVQRFPDQVSAQDDAMKAACCKFCMFRVFPMFEHVGLMSLAHKTVGSDSSSKDYERIFQQSTDDALTLYVVES